MGVSGKTRTRGYRVTWWTPILTNPHLTKGSFNPTLI
jgi:hypothetical protein